MARHDKSAARRLRLRLSYGRLTVRQLQKLISRAATGFDQAAIRNAQVMYFPEVPLESIPALLARLAARYGPDALLAEAVKREARPKGTDEVAPATQQEDGDLHGGDGASGEVDHPVSPSGEGEAETSVPPSGEGEVETSVPQSGESDVERPLPQIGKERYRSPRRSPEAFASLGKADAPPPDEVRRVRAAMAQLVAFGGQGETSPRWDTSELVKRLISRRPLWPARRDEEGRPSILVLPDVSGSCYAIARESLRLARAVALLGVPGAEVLIVSHVNGKPHEIQVGTSAPIVEVSVSEEFAALTGFYQRLIKTYMVEAVVAVGDSDAEDVYRWLSSHPAISRLVWLDNSFCRRLERPRSAPLTRWPAPARQKTTRLVGCKKERFAEALELALRA